MSCSKPLPPFVFDSLYYLNRNQLERFSIVCRPLKNFIDRYLHSKPYRVFDELWICGGSYALFHNHVQWHPNRDDYSAQKFLAGEKLHYRLEYYSFAEMRPYLGQSVRIKDTWIYQNIGTTYNPEHIEQMESISHLWCDRKINVWKDGSKIVAEDFQLILNSPTILQCRYLYMENAHFSFKDYKVLYNAKIIENYYYDNKTDSNYWPQFLEQPGVKPLVVLRDLYRNSINTVIDHLSKAQSNLFKPIPLGIGSGWGPAVGSWMAFSSAVSPNAFKIVFAENRKPLTEFRKTNETSGEKLELKKGLPIEYQDEYLNKYFNYTLERSRT
ncbi:hypothetical protein Ddc_23530 [Ditylenchus destructor]|nr:hypothetical protein Ddc_23530 [Ditylenchus destructor]